VQNIDQSEEDKEDDNINPEDKSQEESRDASGFDLTIDDS
jgi:hypothetical protein|tara:strand:+ start:712 stop:831 length:120 start_codon:yes stop_codon:yes gene_type:complete